jgi:hypothetical protein
VLVRHALAPKVAVAGDPTAVAVAVGLVDEVDSADTKLPASYRLMPL